MRIPAIIGVVIGLVLSFSTALAQAPPKQNLWGCANATGTSGTVVIAAQGAGELILISTISTANTGATASLVTIQSDPAGTPVTLWQTINPAGGGSNIPFDVAIVVPPNKAVGFTATSASTTQYVCIAGYKYP